MTTPQTAQPSGLANSDINSNTNSNRFHVIDPMSDIRVIANLPNLPKRFDIDKCHLL